MIKVENWWVFPGFEIEVIGDNFTKIPGSHTWGLNGRIILAILRDAVPEQIGEFQRAPNRIT